MLKGTFRSVILSTVMLGAAATAPVAALPMTASADSTPQQWMVQVGQMSSDMSKMAMSFFPNSIVIDAGDSISFNGFGHTVEFPGAGPLPAPGSPVSLTAAGSGTYDGTQYLNSGLMMGKPYNVTFTQPGVYPYYCSIHAGMAGVVVVQEPGTPYPMTQQQYDQIGTVEAQEDLAAVQTALTAFQVKTTPGKNHTTVYHVQTDLPELSSYEFGLNPTGPAMVMGSATIVMKQPGVWQVSGTVSGLTAGQTYQPELNWGISDSGKTVAGSSFGAVTASSKGVATFTGTVKGLAVPQGAWVLNINDANGNAVASDAIEYPSFAYERFLPGNLTIHQGDTVVWTQMGPNEAHTITFGSASSFKNPLVRSGGSVYNATGNFNSGYLFPGKTYSLTFTKPGTYTYSCLLHSIMNMSAKVTVLPTKH